MAENKNNGNFFYAGDFEKYKNACLEYVSKYAQKVYLQNVESKIVFCESPIEKAFLLAIEAFTLISEGFEVYPQYQIGKYRVDFLICCSDGNTERKLIVELDGHQFHEMNESQRRYEKERDRYFQFAGFKVFHYTGRQVIANPFKIVMECIKILISEKW